MQEDDGIFGRIESAIESLFTNRPLNDEAARFGPNELIAFLTSNYRVVVLDGHDPDLSGVDLSDTFLAAAQRGHAGITAAMHATLAPEPGNIGPTTARIRGIASSIMNSRKFILNPYTGDIVTTTSSLGGDWYFYSDGGLYFLASCAGMVAAHETVWVLPGSRLILYVQCGLNPDDILRETGFILTRSFLSATKTQTYLFDTGKLSNRDLAVADYRCPHIAHNLWEIQAGWDNLFARIDPGLISKFLIFQNQDFFGGLDEIFTDLAIDKTRIESVANEDAQFQRMLDDNLLLFTIRDNRIRATLSKRIVERAYRLCGREFISRIADIKPRIFPLIIITVRLDNRAWLEQAEGYPALINALHAEFPGLGIVIDGLNADTEKGWTSNWMTLDAELSVASRIRDQLDLAIPVFMGMGARLTESIVLCDLADIFIAPAGSGMTIYKWLTNKPGIAFSNRSVLDENSDFRWQLRVWHDPEIRSDITPTYHIPPKDVVDVPSERGGASRSNFNMDWQVLLNPAISLLNTLAQP